MPRPTRTSLPTARLTFETIAASVASTLAGRASGHSASASSDRGTGRIRFAARYANTSLP